MRRIKLLILAAMVLFSLTCMAGNLPRTPPANTPVEEPTVAPFPTQIPTFVPYSPTSDRISIPAWVKDFANPVLTVLADRRPDFQDDFSGFNLGWFYVISGNPDGPYYARIQDEALLLKMTDETERGNSMVYNPRLIRRNFVLSLDFKFGKTQPDDVLRFQFNQTTDQSVELDLSRNEKWYVDWSFHNHWRSGTGTYDYFSPERINVTIIMQGSECAVYLNHDPLDYLRDCRSGPMVQSSPLAVSFHLLSHTGSNAAVTIDNVKLWDLDKIPHVP